MSTWTTKSGKSIKIVRMETSHIIHCMKMLERKYNRDALLNRYGFNDGELMYYDEEYEDIGDQSIEEVFPIYVSLKKELENRGIYEY